MNKRNVYVNLNVIEGLGSSLKDYTSQTDKDSGWYEGYPYAWEDMIVLNMEDIDREYCEERQKDDIMKTIDSLINQGKFDQARGAAQLALDFGMLFKYENRTILKEIKDAETRAKVLEDAKKENIDQFAKNAFDC